MDVYIRWMIRRDLEEVMAIENACFQYPWKHEDFTNCMRMRNCINLVAENNDGIIVGFMCYDLNKTTIEIRNLAVAPFQGKGIGRRFVGRLIDKLDDRRRRVVAVVRETNLDALLFFKAMGFLASGIIPKHWTNDEDAIRMVYRAPVKVRIAT